MEELDLENMEESIDTLTGALAKSRGAEAVRLIAVE